ncbi:DUF262 domain-containing protein [Stigmatella erecta]|uniref:Uncharacterized conserved protein, contains ParB-like and HNH nuclease domains n=1 Tax=Stigmatella erecta TaxID=83460 RepID=A0A1I0L1J8_9BACT|nr:DUF262 domain-containing protein [Stigmatella erecta]SEU33217.1 Uncharacterized conserved protein, contains ParB-like and HNH nuclease domains [Stigmatella erecta]
MQVQKTTIESLFTHERRYVIPLFQRSYVWTEENQWSPLWDDLREFAERELEIIKSGKSPEQQWRPHFLGAIVLQPRAVSGDHLPELDVIDGQQRLTTLQLFLVVLHDIAKAHGDTATAKWASSRTENGNALVNIDVEKYKVWPTQRDQAQFIELFTAGSRGALETKYPAKIGRRKAERPVMVEAYLFFYRAIEDWFAAQGGDAVTCGKALRLTLQRRMELVQIDLEANENPQEIFETLNARGVPLLASDLLRNFIFLRTKNPSQLHQKYWARFDEPDNAAAPEGLRFWEVEERQGRLSRARLDLFVQHYLAMMLGRDVRIGELFREYKNWIEQQKPFAAIEDELQNFVRYADHFRALLRPDINTALGVFAARLRALDISTVYPLVLALLGEPKLSADERQGIFTDIESFLIRRMVCGRPTKSYTRKFLDLLRDFRNAGALTRGDFRKLLAAGSADVFDWPSDKEFESAWDTVNAYKSLKPERVEMVLRAIELSSRSSKSEPIVLKEGALTIEHVMPQQWEQHWPLPANTDDVAAREAREEAMNAFGNLTLLTQALNSSVSNGPAAQKLPAIVTHSNLELSKWFISRTTWTEDDIRERTRSLFKKAVLLWPRP